MQKIKSLIFDLDGTAVQKDPKAMPSQAVIDAVRKAKEKCHVSVATGRVIDHCDRLLDKLEIEDLCIINGGTQIYSMKTKEYVWQKEMDPNVLTDLFSRLGEYTSYAVADEKNVPPVPLADYKTNIPISLSCIFATTKEDSEKIVELVNKNFPDLNAFALGSWTHGFYDIHISHSEANKKHALALLLEMQGVSSESAMVVGDGGNDIPLFEAAGLRIAMGNAADELKNISDWVAPSVDDDGLAVAIEKFILAD